MDAQNNDPEVVVEGDQGPASITVSGGESKKNANKQGKQKVVEERSLPNTRWRTSNSKWGSKDFVT